MPKRHFVEAETPLRAQRGLGELPLLGIQQEEIGHRSRQGDAAVEDLRRIGAELALEPVAVGDGPVQAFGEIPPLHQPAANLGVIDLQLLDLVLGKGQMVALQRFPLRVQIRQGLVERQHAHVLEQRRQKYFLGHRMMHGIAERARRGRRQQGSPPIKGIAQSVRFAAAQRFDQGKTQGEGERGIQSQHHQRLPQVLALAALGVQG